MKGTIEFEGSESIHTELCTTFGNGKGVIDVIRFRFNFGDETR